MRNLRQVRCSYIFRWRRWIWCTVLRQHVKSQLDDRTIVGDLKRVTRAEAGRVSSVQMGSDMPKYELGKKDVIGVEERDKDTACVLETCLHCPHLSEIGTQSYEPKTRVVQFGNVFCNNVG